MRKIFLLLARASLYIYLHIDISLQHALVINQVLIFVSQSGSITCITCKLFEHIICRHVLDHLEQHKILTDLQHGFRSGRSCETQLITTFQDIAEMYDKKGSQIDIAILDFSKAFDTVPHDGLLSKLKHYGMDKNIWQWISSF